MDIGDAFLTVPQVEPTVMSSGSETFVLGKVLPGHRDGSQLWFESVSSFSSEQLGFNEDCLLLSHVDDMLVLTEQQYFNIKLLPALTGKYKVCFWHEAAR